jgi:hypothetical protein
MSHAITSVHVSEDSFDSGLPTRSEWADFRHFLDADFDGYPDEAPELDDVFYLDPDPEDLAWLAALTEDGCNPDAATPHDLEFLTISARDWQFDDDAATDAMYDERRDAFLGEVG